MLKVHYYYSACVGIRAPKVSVLCDPWFSEGIYDGSWYQYPRLADPLRTIGKYDYIYVSHIHPDHFDPLFLKTYLAAFPETKVIIADFQNNFLSKKMAGNGIRHEIVRDLNVGGVRLRVFPNETNHIYDIDSALAVVEKETGHSVVNMNDNPFNADLMEHIREFTGGSVTIALLGYTGAGPYPQTYFDEGPELIERAAKKKQDFFGRYRRLQEALGPKATIPFAGKYVLGGKLGRMNKFRGVADAVEVCAFDKTAVVLDDGGDAFIDTESLQANRVRTQPYDPGDVEAYVRSLETREQDYERFFRELPPSAIPFRMLLPKAGENAVRKSECDSDYWFCIKLGDVWFALNANKNKQKDFRFEKDVSAQSPRSEIGIDPRYLYGLITGVFHWNNAEVGSQFITRRIPDAFNRDAQNFLSFFHL